jgi:CRP-like cAMP-binding protein
MVSPLHFKVNDKNLTDLLEQVLPFQNLSKNELRSVSSVIKRYAYEKDEIVIREGETGSTAYIVEEGDFCLEILGRVIKTFSRGAFFGEIALIDTRPRMGTVRALTRANLFTLDRKDLEDETHIPAKTAMKLYQAFARMVTSYMRESKDIYNEMDILLIQDGGCAPGYNPVTAFITEYLEKAGRKVYIAA